MSCIGSGNWDGFHTDYMKDKMWKTIISCTVLALCIYILLNIKI